MHQCSSGRRYHVTGTRHFYGHTSHHSLSPEFPKFMGDPSRGVWLVFLSCLLKAPSIQGAEVLCLCWGVPQLGSCWCGWLPWVTVHWGVWQCQPLRSHPTWWRAGPSMHVQLLLTDHINMTPVEERLTETQDLSSLDAGWLPWEDRKAGPTRHPLMDLPRTPVTVSDAMYGRKNDAFPLRDIFTLKKTSSSRSNVGCFPTFSGW